MSVFIIDLDESHREEVIIEILAHHHEIYFSRPEIAQALESLGSVSWATYVVPFSQNIRALRWRGHTMRKGVGHHSIGLWAATYCEMSVVSENLLGKDRNQEIVSAAKREGRVVKYVSCLD
jgi:hypothetical protein